MKRSDAAGGFLSKPTIKMTDKEYRLFLIEELKKSAMSLNEMKPFMKASMFYDPEICDIHNEGLTEHAGPSLKELIAKENKASRDTLQGFTKKHPLLNISRPSIIPMENLNTRQTNLRTIKKADIETLEKEISDLKDLLPPPPMTRKIFD